MERINIADLEKQLLSISGLSRDKALDYVSWAKSVVADNEKLLSKSREQKRLARNAQSEYKKLKATEAEWAQRSNAAAVTANDVSYKDKVGNCYGSAAAVVDGPWQNRADYLLSVFQLQGKAINSRLNRQGDEHAGSISFVRPESMTNLWMPYVTYFSGMNEKQLEGELYHLQQLAAFSIEYMKSGAYLEDSLSSGELNAASFFRDLWLGMYWDAFGLPELKDVEPDFAVGAFLFVLTRISSIGRKVKLPVSLKFSEAMTDIANGLKGSEASQYSIFSPQGSEFIAEHLKNGAGLFKCGAVGPKELFLNMKKKTGFKPKVEYKGVLNHQALVGHWGE